jgi:hypothetical protein
MGKRSSRSRSRTRCGRLIGDSRQTITPDGSWLGMTCHRLQYVEEFGIELCCTEGDGSIDCQVDEATGEHASGGNKDGNSEKVSAPPHLLSHGPEHAVLMSSTSSMMTPTSSLIAF